MDGHDSLIAGRVGSYVRMEGNYKTYFSLCTSVRTKNPLEGGLKMHEGGFLWMEIAKHTFPLYICKNQAPVGTGA